MSVDMLKLMAQEVDKLLKKRAVVEVGLES
jgi:hypothetical protein